VGSDLNDFQTTIRSRVTLAGVGVHTGKPVSIGLAPADADTGLVFHCLDADGQDHEVRALVSEVALSDLSTVLGDPSRGSVATVEHLMATVYALGIDNLAVDIDGPELPILDGSAAPFVEALDQAGTETLTAKRRYIRVLNPVRVEHGASWAEFHPYAGTRLEVEIDYPTPTIGRQAFACDLGAEFFRTEVARARTFGFMKDVERLWAAGYALGSSLENSVVIGEDDRIINMEGLRYPDEFVRHKMLDAMGDLALAGARFIGCFRSHRGGHRLNANALRRLLDDRSAFEVVETQRRDRGHSAEMVTVAGPRAALWMG